MLIYERPVIDLFAGPGGWDVGLSSLGLTNTLGYEIDADACATAVAAGHDREQADLADIGLARAHAGIDGLVASPPCQGFSVSGLRRGIGDIPTIMQAVADLGAGVDPHLVHDQLTRTCRDHRSAFVVVPLIWVLLTEPTWTCWEQVPAVLPLWQACAEVLSAAGWSAVAGTLSAEAYGVPQTRRRAVLVASRRHEARLPAPTHSRYHSRDPRRLDDGVRPWVSMAQALEWGMTERPAHTVTSGGTGSGGGVEVFGNYSRRVVMQREIDEGRWLYPPEDGEDGMPAPGWRRSDGEHPTVAAVRPATTESMMTKATRVSISEAAVLQSFSADYPWRGSRTSQFGQVGNAVPPRLAARVVMAALGSAG